MVCRQPLRRQSDLRDCRNRYLVHYPFGLRARIVTEALQRYRCLPLRDGGVMFWGLLYSVQCLLRPVRRVGFTS